MVDRLVNSEVNARRIAIVESCFGSSGQPLAVNGRVLVGEGILTKMCRKRPKARQFFLFNDILVYGNIVISKKKYNSQRVIPLEEVQLVDVPDDNQCRNGWVIRTRSKSFAVYAATAAEKLEWMAHIRKCVEDLLKKSGKQGATDHAAVWVPDTEAKLCMCCGTSQFNLINRRHHCRNCGKVVCGPCSNKKFLLPSQSTRALRVCNTCFEKLSERQMSRSEEAALATKHLKSRSESADSSSDDSDDEANCANRNPSGAEDNRALFYGGIVADPAMSAFGNNTPGGY